MPPIVIAVVTAVSAIALVASVAMKIADMVSGSDDNSGATYDSEAIKNNSIMPIDDNQSIASNEVTPLNKAKTTAIQQDNRQQVQAPAQTQTAQVFDANQGTQEAVKSAAAPIPKKVDIKPVQQEQPITTQNDLTQAIVGEQKKENSIVNSKSLLGDTKIKTGTSANDLVGDSQKPVETPNLVTPTQSASAATTELPDIKQMQNQQKILQPTMVYNPATSKFEVQMK